MLLEGLQLPLTTPFYPDGRLNTLKLEHNVDRYCRTPAAGLVVLSEWGESTLLSESESRQTLLTAIQAASPRKVMIAGVSRDSVIGTLDRIEVAAELKYDAVLVRRPAVLAGQAGTKESLNYFQMMADRSALPVILASGPQQRGEMLSAESVIELATHPRIIGALDRAAGHKWIAEVVAGTTSIRRNVTVTAVFGAVTARMQGGSSNDTSGTFKAENSKEGSGGLVVLPAPTVIRTRTKAIGFQVLVGGTNGMLEGLMAGAAGVAPPFAASAPQACYEALAAWKDGDAALAREKQSRLHDVVVRIEEELGVAAIKFGCDLNGYFGGLPRLPLLPLTGQERAEVERLMQGLRN